MSQKVWSNDLVYEIPFGSRVIHQNSFKSCPGEYLTNTQKLIVLSSLKPK